jgi:hypothetical protein
MIKYTLLCEENHDFEGWFASAAGYDSQAEAGQIKCPCCGTAKVRKAVMTPNVATRSKGAGPGRPVSGEVLELLRAVRDEVLKNADYVGPRFAEEARKIHFGEIEARGIYGEATPAEAKALLDEGVQVQPLPKLPEDNN